MSNFKKYLKIWWVFASNAFQMQMNVRWALIFFFLGKLTRFFIFTFFIVLLVNNTKSLAGYTLDQTLLFFLTFNLVDILAQLFLREVYRFRPAVVSGSFDFYLIKPMSPLFRALASGPDLLDFLTLIPLVLAIIHFIIKLNITDLLSLSLYVLLIASGFVIALSFHILILSLAILTTEIDHAVMVYRDLISLGRMPVDIYKEPIRGFLTFAIPVGIMVSFPVKVLLGLLSPIAVFYSFVFSFLMFYLSLKSWNYALTKYSSASS